MRAQRTVFLLPAIHLGLAWALASACSPIHGGLASDGGRGSLGTGGTRGGTGSRSSVACQLGTVGCTCDPAGGCATGLSCKSGVCCDAASGNCSAPTSTVPGSGVATGTGSVDGGVAACKAGKSGPIALTSCGYPYSSSNPLTSVKFNESEVLRAIVPTGGYPIATIQVFYNDEHALALGVRSVTVNGTTTDYPVAPLPASPSKVVYPETGTNFLTGDQAGVDGAGRPMWPVLYITDITNDPNSTAGDWQQGGKPWNPNTVFGTWKSAVRSGGVVTNDKADPAKNNWDLTASGGPVPAGLANEGYGSEIRWYVSLIPGHAYRIQTMVHDGDSMNGGDVGEACVNFCASDCNNIDGCGPGEGVDGGTPPPTGCPPGVQACVTDGIDPATCPTGTYCSRNCCYPGIL